MTCPFTGNALQTLLQESEASDLCEFIFSSPLQTKQIIASENINSFLYHGAIYEAQELGLRAGNKIKNCTSNVGFDDLVVIMTESGVDAFIKQLPNMKSSFFRSSQVGSIKVAVHDGVSKIKKEVLNKALQNLKGLAYLFIFNFISF